MSQKVYDKSNEKDYDFKSDSFDLVQVDKKIHDVKFETKATTFAKDAFKRFLKNKSSVVGAIIIGVLLICAIILPVVIPYDIKQPHTEQALLPPKLFDAGTGFWDGTKKYENIMFDGSTESPAGFSKDYVLKYTAVNDEEYVDEPNPYATGGSLYLISDNLLPSGSEPHANTYIFQNYTGFNITSTDGYKVKIVFGETDNVKGNKLGEYRVLLKSGSTTIVLKDWSREYGEQEFDLSAVLAANGKTNMANANICIEMARGTSNLTYLLIDSLEITANITDEEELAKLHEISITDANKTALYGKGSDGKFPVGYWRSTTTKGVYQAAIRYVSFVYDVYASKLGNKDISIGGSDMQKYVDNGWCEYDFKVGPSSFKVLDSENCPVIEVYSQSYDNEFGIYNISVKATYYKYLGYDSMPRYILGTTDVGKDLLKVSFNGLRTSLLLAIVASAICFIIGLCWGSISGYFGGNVDLAMERFCEILGGVPWIVVMTLAILLLGNNIITFAMALCLTGWLGTAARTRTQFYRFKGREYVLASRTLGASDARLIFKHILPNSLGTIVTSSVLMIPSVIFSEATLSYLNLGLQGVDSFGVILSENQKYLSSYPALIVFPAVIISLLMISFNLFGNGLRDALNPSLKGSE